MEGRWIILVLFCGCGILFFFCIGYRFQWVSWQYGGICISFLFLVLRRLRTTCLPFSIFLLVHVQSLPQISLKRIGQSSTHLLDLADIFSFGYLTDVTLSYIALTSRGTSTKTNYF